MNGANDHELTAAAVAESANQLRRAGIRTTVANFSPILSEFYAYIDNFASLTRLDDYGKSYIKRLQNLYAIFNQHYDIRRKTMIVNFMSYDVNQWGRLYWNFLHYASILLQDALVRGLIYDTADFSIIIYNIDAILSCSTCRGHYRAIKTSPRVTELIKLIAFGHPIEAVYKFHSLITRNKVEQMFPARMAMRERMLRDSTFVAHEFASLYKVYPITSLSLRKMDKVQKLPIDWQESAHVALSALLAIDFDVPYSRASNRIKRTAIYTQTLYEHMYLLQGTLTINEFQTENDIELDRSSDNDILCALDANMREPGTATTYTRICRDAIRAGVSIKQLLNEKTKIIKDKNVAVAATAPAVLVDQTTPLDKRVNITILDETYQRVLGAVKRDIRQIFYNYPTESLVSYFTRSSIFSNVPQIAPPPPSNDAAGDTLR